jgi:formyltetrahydrofolate deformylase
MEPIARPNASFILTLMCPDAVGIVAALTTELARYGGLITEAHHYREPVSSSSILRIVFETGDLAAIDLARLESDFASVAEGFRMTWETHDASLKPRVLVAVSKEGHCLKSLLHRWEVETLPIEIVGALSNHETHRRLVEWLELPFYYLPIESGRKVKQEEKMLTLFADSKADLLVLARYMQILTDNACRELADRAINIHHSFLPGFKGANPLPTGLRPWCHADRRHSALRQRRSGRGADHRAGRRTSRSPNERRTIDGARQRD